MPSLTSLKGKVKAKFKLGDTDKDLPISPSGSAANASTSKPHQNLSTTPDSQREEVRALVAKGIQKTKSPSAAQLSTGPSTEVISQPALQPSSPFTTIPRGNKSLDQTFNSQDSVLATPGSVAGDPTSEDTAAIREETAPGSGPLANNLPNLWKLAIDSLSERDQLTLKRHKIGDKGSGEKPDTRQDVDSIIEHANLRLKEDDEKKWKSVMNKLLDGVDKFKSLVDAGMKFDKSGYGALAWSVLSFGLQMTLNAKDLREGITNSSEAITQIIARYAAYEILYRGSAPTSTAFENFDKLVIDVYKAILLYCIAMEAYLQESDIVHQAKGFIPAEERTLSSRKKTIDSADSAVKEWLPILKSEIDDKSFSELQKKVNAAMLPIYHLAKRMGPIQSFLKMDERREIFSWLPDAQKDSVHTDTLNKPKIKNPGNWILEMNEFQNWQNSKVSCGLWLSGALGTGKTILASTVIKHIDGLYDDTSQGAFAYYYCSGTANSKTTASDLLGNILRQLAGTDAGLNILKRWELRNRRRDLTHEAMGYLIRRMIELNNVAQTTIIIDALDEADQESFLEVMELLEGVLSEGSGLVKIFLTSRPEDYINTVLGTWPKIEVDPKLTRTDIETYIESQVDKRLRLKKQVSDDLKIEVKTFLKRRAKGMFRYVEMAVRWICEPSNPYDIQLAMKELPDDLLGVYRDLFQMIDKDRHQRKELARRAISWVLAAQSQVSAQEAVKAITSGYENYEADVMVEDVISSCHHLMIYNKSSNILEFGHFSVVEYIKEYKQDEYGASRIHDLTAFICLNSILQTAYVLEKGKKFKNVEKYVRSLTRDSSDSATDWQLDGSFWSYATNMWAFHCEQSGSDTGSSHLWSECLSSWSTIKEETGTVPFTKQSNASFGTKSIGNRVPERSAASFHEWLFMVSAAFGIYETLTRLIRVSPQLINFRSREAGVGGLHWVARWGHLKTLNLLLDSGAVVDLTDNANWTPLAYAISGQRKDIVQVLLSPKWFADPNASSLANVSLLALAERQGFQEAVEALLHAGAKPVAKPNLATHSDISEIGSLIPHYIYKDPGEVPFEVYGELGVGGFAVVEAVRTRDSPPLNLARKLFYERSREAIMEVTIMPKLNHKHIVKLISSHEIADGKLSSFGILMSPIADENLRHYMDRINNGDLINDDIRRLEKWMLCLATTLAYMHSQRVRHGDIKPENILCKGEDVCLCDFHLALQYGSDPSEQFSDPLMEVVSPTYAAPEFYHKTLISYPSDVFMLGEVFSEMATAISNRSNDDFSEYRSKLSVFEPDIESDAFAAAIPEVKRWLMERQIASTDLILKMLTEDPEKRPTAAEVVSALMKINRFPTCDCAFQFAPP